jgi:hypothetical protein
MPHVVGYAEHALKNSPLRLSRALLPRMLVLKDIRRWNDASAHEKHRGRAEGEMENTEAGVMQGAPQIPFPDAKLRQKRILPAPLPTALKTSLFEGGRYGRKLHHIEAIMRTKPEHQPKTHNGFRAMSRRLVGILPILLLLGNGPAKGIVPEPEGRAVANETSLEYFKRFVATPPRIPVATGLFPAQDRVRQQLGLFRVGRAEIHLDQHGRQLLDN